MKTNLIRNAIIGMGIGFPITLFMMRVIGGPHSVLTELLAWMIASAFYGILSGILFYGKKELALPIALIFHCFGCFFITMGAATFCGYLTDWADFFPILIPFILIYAVIYAICCFIMKRNEQQVNQLIQKK